MQTQAGSGKHIRALDGVRGLAVLIVFLFHYGGGTHSSNTVMRAVGLANKGGWSGVTLFFVLSGFLITGILWDGFEDKHWWRKFFVRRSLRIFPLYFLTLGMVLAGAMWAGTGREALRQIWIAGLFLENFPRLGTLSDSITSPLSIFHLWSIAVEEQFYLLWPFLLFLVRKGRRQAQWLCAMVFVASALFRVWVWHVAARPEDYAHFLPTQAGALALGGWLAISARGAEWERVVRWAPTAVSVGFVGFVASGVASHGMGSEGHYMTKVGLPFVTVMYAGVVALAAEPGRVARVFSVGWLRWLGGVSYGFYIFHMLFLSFYGWVTRLLVGGRGQNTQNLVQLLIAAAVSAILAQISFSLYERQFLRLKKYFVPTRR